MYNQHCPPEHDILRAIGLKVLPPISESPKVLLGINPQETHHIPKIKSLELKSDILHL